MEFVYKITVFKSGLNDVGSLACWRDWIALLFLFMLAVNAMIMKAPAE